jgi:hypothetical protein
MPNVEGTDGTRSMIQPKLLISLKCTFKYQSYPIKKLTTWRE